MATRWGIVGAGKISHDFTSCVRSLPADEHKVVAIAARSISSAQKFAQLHQIPKAYGSYVELAKDPNVDVAYIGVIHSSHYEVAKLMLQNGKNVLCEKPCTLTLKNTKELTGLARSKNVFFMEAIWSRFVPAYRDISKLIKEGAIGDPQYVHVSFGFPLLHIDRITRPEMGGSVLLDIGIYCLNLAQFVYGDEIPTQIVAVGHVSPEGVDQSVAVSLKYSNNRLATILASGFCKFPNEGEIVGSKGTIKLHDPFFCPTKLETPVGPIEHQLPDSALPCNFMNSEGLRYEAMEVRRCLKQGLTESPILKHEHSVQLAALMDEVRRQIGVKYDVDE